MGAFKRLLMAREEKFWEEAEELMGESESLAEFLHRVKQPIIEYMDHWDNERLEAELIDGWEEYWSKYYERNG